MNLRRTSVMSKSGLRHSRTFLPSGQKRYQYVIACLLKELSRPHRVAKNHPRQSGPGRIGVIVLLDAIPASFSLPPTAPAGARLRPPPVRRRRLDQAPDTGIGGRSREWSARLRECVLPHMQWNIIIGKTIRRPPASAVATSDSRASLTIDSRCASFDRCPHALGATCPQSISTDQKAHRRSGL